MQLTSLALLAALVPALASASHTPPHIRHRRLQESIRHIHDKSNPQDARALAARANEAHADAHRAIKKGLKKRGQNCRPRNQNAFQASSSASAVSPASSTTDWTAPSSTTGSPAWSPSPVPTSTDSGDSASSIAQVAAYAKHTSSAAWSAPSPSADSGNSNTGGVSINVGGLLQITDNSCGSCDSNSDQPNCSEDFLNCGINNGGWTPPQITIDQLIAADLNGNGVFSPCSQYISKFQQYGGQHGIPPIMLASFAMQESGCNAGATGGNGEAGLMQIAPINCEAGNNCWDVDYNINRGAQLFSQMISANGGNVLAAIGSYNGWTPGQTTYNSATAAKAQGHCFAQNNLDYLYQFCNGWMQGKDGTTMGTYFNLNSC